MSATDRIAATLDELGTRTGCEVAKVHALLAIAEAIRETRQPQDQPAPERKLRCQSISGRLQCELTYDHPGSNHCATINWTGP